MNINWDVVFSYRFWFMVDSAGLNRSDHWILYGGAAMVIFGIALLVFRMMAKNQFLKKVSMQFANIFITIGLLEVVWFGMRFENANALGTKFTAGLIALVGLIWMYWPVKYLITKYKTDMTDAKRKVMRDKYLNFNKR